MIRSVFAAMCASSVVGDDEKKGGLWCSPIANTSSPTSSAFCAMRTIESIRSASLGVCPLTAFLVMSLTEKIPNCIVSASSPHYMSTHTYYMTAHQSKSVGDDNAACGERWNRFTVLVDFPTGPRQEPRSNPNGVGAVEFDQLGGGRKALAVFYDDRARRCERNSVVAD